jgi:serine/threonine protein kinase
MPCAVSSETPASLSNWVQPTAFSSCDKTPYVVKPVSESFLEHLQELRAEFESHPRLRIHINKIEKESILVYEYFKNDLLALVQNYPPLPLTARKKILKEIGNTLTEMHKKNWIHLGTKLTECHAPALTKALLIWL